MSDQSLRTENIIATTIMVVSFILGFLFMGYVVLSDNTDISCGDKATTEMADKNATASVTDASDDDAPTTSDLDGQWYNAANTSRSYSLSWDGSMARISSSATTEYYDKNDNVRDIMQTQTDFLGEIIGDSLLITCECQAQHNDAVVRKIFQNDITFTNTEITLDEIKENETQCSNDCIDLGRKTFGLPEK